MVRPSKVTVVVPIQCAHRAFEEPRFPLVRGAIAKALFRPFLGPFAPKKSEMATFRRLTQTTHASSVYRLPNYDVQWLLAVGAPGIG